MRRRLRLVREIDRRGEPGRRLRWVVLEEGGELAPPLRPLHERSLAPVDAAELCGQRQVRLDAGDRRVEESLRFGTIVELPRADDVRCNRHRHAISVSLIFKEYK